MFFSVYGLVTTKTTKFFILGVLFIGWFQATFFLSYPFEYKVPIIMDKIIVNCQVLAFYHFPKQKIMEFYTGPKYVFGTAVGTHSQTRTPPQKKKHLQSFSLASLGLDGWLGSDLPALFTAITLMKRKTRLVVIKTYACFKF